jgi:NADPH-dependent 2,4-dienoyl-CoA reductase/sulfur reductase-like enzyme
VRVVVVGAAVAGVAACAGLRAAGYAGEVVLVGDERHAPYDRPPLSKQVLCGTMGQADIGLPVAARLDELGVVHRAGCRATGLDLRARELELDGAERLPFDGVVIATGSAARRLPGQPEAGGLHVLRTLDDALALRAELARARHVAVIGAGFIGLEVASSARSLDARATVLEAAPSPMARIFGPELGRRFAELHAEHGVEVRCGVAVERVRVQDGRVTGVEVATGPAVEADVVVVGIGAAPATGWLEGSGLALADGVVCDARLRAAAGVYAAGDVARWDHPRFGPIRVEHWTTAGDHARTAAWNLAAELAGRPERARVAGEIPYFWSDQHGVKIQMAGWVQGYDDVHEVESGRRWAVLFGRGGALVGAMTWGWPAFLARQRRAIAAGTPWPAAVEASVAASAGARSAVTRVDSPSSYY